MKRTLLPATAFLLMVLCALQAHAAPAQPEPGAAASLPPVLQKFHDRLAHVRKELPDITAAAEAVADRWIQRETVGIVVPDVSDSESFGAELAFRAGGLDNVRYIYERPAELTHNDVMFYAPRSWEEAETYVRDEVTKNREAGKLSVVFASRAGMPEGLPIDFLIDNGAAGGGEDEAAMNQIVNVTNGWLWCCELTAALTRRGKRPGVLLGMTLPGSTAHNAEYQGKPSALYPYEGEPIAAGALAEEYLRELERTVADLATPGQQAQIAKAADIAAERLEAGKEVWASSFTHVLDAETLRNLESPMRAFRGISVGPEGEAFKERLDEGDLIFFFGEWTVNLPGRDTIAVIRSTGADYIPSYRPIREPMEPMEGDEVFYTQDLDGALMVLEQRWPLLNAVVDIPFPPGKMAPVSGVYVCLQYRLLDAAIAERVGAAAAAAP